MKQGARRRIADGAADHRDAGRRPLGLHPDQRHLDHRRPDLPRERPVPPGRASGDQRRQLGVARRRLGAGQGDAPGRRLAAPRPRAVPRARGVRAVRQRSRQGDAQPAQSRPPAGRGPEAAAVSAARRSRSRSSSSTPRPTAILDAVPVERVRDYEIELFKFLDTRRAQLLSALAEKKEIDDQIKARPEPGAEGVRRPVRRGDEDGRGVTASGSEGERWRA